VIKSLEALLVDNPLPKHMCCICPLPVGALGGLSELPHERNPLTPELVPLAQQLAGTVGFVATMARPDAYFGYCAIARHANALRLTRHSFNMLLRLCHYIVSTKSMVLTLTSRERSNHGWDMFDVHADSSHGNAEGGRSYGGFVLIGPTTVESDPDQQGLVLHRSGGAIAWKCFAPPEGDDSSAAAELRNVTTAIKYTMDLDVDIAPTRPTDLYTDAQAVIDGKGGERMPKSSRWMGTRYAMVRHAEDSETVKLRKARAADNVADIVTKCLGGEAFKLNRAKILGQSYYPTQAPGPDISAAAKKQQKK
jgi:hypothetical protein